METTIRRSEEDVAKNAETPFQEWMLRRGIKQSWLSEQTGLRQSVISKFATQRQKPNIDQAHLIVKAFQLITPDVTTWDLWPLPEKEESN